VEQMPALATCTSASPSPGAGSGQSLLRSSCPVESSNTSACMAACGCGAAMAPAPRLVRRSAGRFSFIKSVTAGVLHRPARVSTTPPGYYEWTGTTAEAAHTHKLQSPSSHPAASAALEMYNPLPGQLAARTARCRTDPHAQEAELRSCGSVAFLWMQRGAQHYRHDPAASEPRLPVQPGMPRAGRCIAPRQGKAMLGNPRRQQNCRPSLP
jgi:hypothetical protein